MQFILNGLVFISFPCDPCPCLDPSRRALQPVACRSWQDRGVSAEGTLTPAGLLSLPLLFAVPGAQGSALGAGSSKK